MEKFSKIKNQTKPVDKTEILLDSDYLKVRQVNNWAWVEEADNVCCIPILIDENKIFVRQEVIPPFTYRDSNELFLTVISGTVEKGEAPEETLRRELVEEAGIVLNKNYKITFIDVLFKNKGTTSKIYYALIPLSKGDYYETHAKGDGSIEEKKSKTVKVDLRFINQLQCSDLITKLLLLEVKNFMLIK